MTFSPQLHPRSLNWIIAYHLWRAQNCRASWEHYRYDPAMRSRALPYLHEARASEELAALARRQAQKLMQTEGEA